MPTANQFGLIPVMMLAMCLVAAVSGCAGMPPGAKFPKTVSLQLAHPEQSRIGSQVAAAAQAHAGQSGFRIVTAGVDGLLVRAQMIDAAELSLDIQYFIFRGDATGRLLTAALKRAADRGVRVRVLLDDADTIAGDEQILALDGHENTEIRVFNPLAYRGHSNLRRGVEFLFNARRLDYRMHNKLLVADNSVALVGGRNIGDQYFQIDPESQFADDDVFAAGPIAGELSASFDEFWNSGLAIPIKALSSSKPKTVETAALSADLIARIASGEPYAAMTSGRSPLVWARARVISDSPDKRQVLSGARQGRLLNPAVLQAAAATEVELLMVTPYFIPASDEVQLLQDLRQRHARVRILTNSLESDSGLFAHSGYMKVRVPMLKQGIELYEARAQLGNSRGSGQSAGISRHGNYALHAKLFVFDRRQLLIGSMNFDRRSEQLNTEVGLVVDSPELAEQTAARFAAMVQPANAYVLSLRQLSDQPYWHTEVDGRGMGYVREPARSTWQRLAVRLVAMLPFFGREK